MTILYLAIVNLATYFYYLRRPKKSWWTDIVGWNLETIWEISPMAIPTLIDVFIPGGIG